MRKVFLTRNPSHINELSYGTTAMIIARECGLEMKNVEIQLKHNEAAVAFIIKIHFPRRKPSLKVKKKLLKNLFSRCKNVIITLSNERNYT